MADESILDDILNGKPEDGEKQTDRPPRKGVPLGRHVRGKLSDVAIRHAKVEPGKSRKYLGDGGGLQLLVTAEGSKRWQLQYKRDGKQHCLGLGTWPDVSLTKARKKREDLMEMIDAGMDPVAEKRKAKAAQEAQNRTFRIVAEEWYARNSLDAARNTLLWKRRMLTALEDAIGDKVLSEVTKEDLARALEPLYTKPVTYWQTATIAQAIFAYAIDHDYVAADVSSRLKSKNVAPKKTATRNHPAIKDPAELARLLLAIDEYPSATGICTRFLQLLPLVVTRPSELRESTWEEFDLTGDHPIWTIPANRMKKRRPHIVPLPLQAVALLEDVRQMGLMIYGASQYVFPSRRGGCLSATTVQKALKCIGYKDLMTLHGFRSSFSTIVNGNPKIFGARREAVEAQLAHDIKDKTEGAYNRGDYLEERRELMEKWANFLDAIKEQARGEA